MQRFKKPEAMVVNGQTVFVLYDGSITKKVHSFYEFNDVLGGFVILNDKQEEVEFMDCLGNFTKKPTAFAKYFNTYINSACQGIKYGFPFSVYFTTLSDFPSKYLIDKKVRKIVKNEENFKIFTAMRCGDLNNLIEVVRYRCLVNDIYKKKIEKANKLLKNLKTKQKIEEIYYEL